MKKADEPIEVTEEEIVILVNDKHLENAYFPNFTKEGGNDILANDEHPKKVYFLINVTEEGIEICFNDEHPEKDNKMIDLYWGFPLKKLYYLVYFEYIFEKMIHLV